MKRVNLQHGLAGLLVLLVVLIAGCGGSGPECSNVYSEGPQKGQCASSEAVSHSEAQESHEQEVKRAQEEAEAVLRHRQAEETANAIEGK